MSRPLAIAFTLLVASAAAQSQTQTQTQTQTLTQWNFNSVTPSTLVCCDMPAGRAAGTDCAGAHEGAAIRNASEMIRLNMDGSSEEEWPSLGRHPAPRLRGYRRCRGQMSLKLHVAHLP